MKFNAKLIIISLGVLCLPFQHSVAQEFSEFNRIFSQRDVYGTARIQGLGGSITALGGDLSSISGNPAGLGFYSSSEMVLSPSFLLMDNSSRYLDGLNVDSKDKFNISNGGVVINRNREAATPSGFKGGSFGISITRTANYQNRLTYQGMNTVEDFIDFAVNEANAQGIDAYDDPELLPELSFLAFQTTLIDRFFDVNASGDSSFFYDRNIYDIVDPNVVAFPTEDFPTLQQESVNTLGAQYQTTFAYGANFSDKIYLGASLGISSIRYEQNRIYREEPTESDLDGFVLLDSRLLDGTGINGTVGLIFKPVKTVNVGISYTTPTFYEMEDQSTISLNAAFDNGSLDDQVSFLPLIFNMRTPGRLNGGLALFFEEYGFITADVEWVDYGGGKISSDDFGFNDVNSQIDNFESVLNFKAGAEFRYSIARFRAGFAQHGDPLNEIDGVDRSRQSFSVGAGLRFNRFFVDGAYVRSVYDQTSSPYPGAPVAITETTAQNVILSLGLRF